MSNADWQYVVRFARSEDIALSTNSITRRTTLGHALDMVMAASGRYPMGGTA